MANPWEDQRARMGLNTLVRVIDLDAERQEFVLLNPKNADDLRDLEFDGCTFVLPPKPRTPAELAEIERASTRSTGLTRTTTRRASARSTVSDTSTADPLADGL
jgi:hypothetical protein